MINLTKKHKQGKKSRIKCSRCGHYLCEICKENGLIWCDTLLWSKDEGGFITKKDLKGEPPYPCCGGKCVVKK